MKTKRDMTAEGDRRGVPGQRGGCVIEGGERDFAAWRKGEGAEKG